MPKAPDRENRESPRLRPVPAADPTPLTPSVAAAIEARLDALQVESEQRRRELREIAAALPQATSRRVLVIQMTRELLTAPDRVSVAKRGVLKIARTPSDVYHRTRARRTR